MGWYPIRCLVLLPCKTVLASIEVTVTQPEPDEVEAGWPAVTPFIAGMASRMSNAHISSVSGHMSAFYFGLSCLLACKHNALVYDMVEEEAQSWPLSCKTFLFPLVMSPKDNYFNTHRDVCQTKSLTCPSCMIWQLTTRPWTVGHGIIL